MRRFIRLFGGAFTVTCLLSVLVSARPRSVRPMPGWQPSALPHQKGVASPPRRPTPAPFRPEVAKGESERRPQSDTSTVTVTCHPDYMEIAMDADLLGLGFPVALEDIQLGETQQTGDACRALPTEPGKYTIAAFLTDCGTEHVITDDSLIYSNTLYYIPSPSPDGLIRTEEKSFPIRCFYKRRFDLDSIPVMPTWVPYMSTRADQGQLEFSLRLMTDDWAFPQATNTFYLGDVIHIQASVTQFNHNPMRVFVVDCVATVSPDPNSVPRYAFIEQGCLMDGYMTDSTSRFLPRQQHDELQFQLDAFRFHQEERAELYITCMLRAEPAGETDGMCRACSFMDNRWQSADNEDQTCGVCVSDGPGLSPPANQKSPPKIQNPASSHGSGSSGSSSRGQSQYVYMRPRSGQPEPRSGQPEPSKGFEKEERIGPIAVLKGKRPGLVPPEAFQGHPQVMPEPDLANPFDVTPKIYTPDGHPKELDKPVQKDLQPATKRTDGLVNQYLDRFLRKATPKELAELMKLLQPSSPVTTDVEAAKKAPMTEAVSLPVKKEPLPTPAVVDDHMADLKPDIDLETSSSSSAPSKEDVLMPGNTEEDGKR